MDTLTTLEPFFAEFTKLMQSGKWTASLDLHAIRLQRVDTEDTRLYSPITAIYFNATAGTYEHFGSFWHEPIAQYFKCPWWIMNELAYATARIDCGGTHYNRALREQLLTAFGLPSEQPSNTPAPRG